MKCKWQSKKGDMAAELAAVPHDASPAFTRLFRPKAFDTTEQVSSLSATKCQEECIENSEQPFSMQLAEISNMCVCVCACFLIKFSSIQQDCLAIFSEAGKIKALSIICQDSKWRNHTNTSYRRPNHPNILAWHQNYFSERTHLVLCTRTCIYKYACTYICIYIYIHICMYIHICDMLQCT